MVGSIVPLPVMLEEEDQKIYDRLEPPKTIVVRYGYQKLVAELPYDGDEKPGCGSKLVIRTPRGMELAEMLTTTCANSGCSKSVSRKEMLQFIENSGGKQFPFSQEGKIVRVATRDDLQQQHHFDNDKIKMLQTVRGMIGELQLDMRAVEVEPLLGGERIIFYYTTEEKWVDFRELVRLLAAEYHMRIEMSQVNAREEARLVADYERCGQYCCCKNFLKVLKPVSMRSAKVQKATLDPKKISGRCGRLMCCLRYEDETYEDLRKRLPHRKQVVETEDGLGTVLDWQILTQLILVKVGDSPPAAYPLENLRILEKEEANVFSREQKAQQKEREERIAARLQRSPQRGGPPRKEPAVVPAAPVTPPVSPPAEPSSSSSETPVNQSDEGRGKKKRRRRRKRANPDRGNSTSQNDSEPSGDPGGQ